MRKVRLKGKATSWQNRNAMLFLGRLTWISVGWRISIIPEILQSGQYLLLCRRCPDATSPIISPFWAAMHLISAVGNDFYGETLLEQTRPAGVNVASCIRLNGQNTSAYVSIADLQAKQWWRLMIPIFCNNWRRSCWTPSRMLIRHAGGSAGWL